MLHVSDARFLRLLTADSSEILGDLLKLPVHYENIGVSDKSFLQKAFKRYIAVAHDVEANITASQGTQPDPVCNMYSTKARPESNRYFPILHKSQCDSHARICQVYRYGNLQIQFTSQIGKESRNAAVLALTLMWMFAPKNCKCLHVRYCANPAKKILPSRAGQILDAVHVNSGYSMLSSQSVPSVDIWRSEEFFKLILHETIHSIGADKLHINKHDLQTFQNRFALQQQEPLLLEETYTEILALVFHCFAIADQSNASFLEILNFERTFAILQTAKLLRHFGMGSFSDVLQGPSAPFRFRETTNAFCYFVLKSAVLHDMSLFLNFVRQNDAFVSKSSRGKMFVELVQKACSDVRFHAAVDVYLRADWSGMSTVINQTLRMTVFELQGGLDS